MVEVSVQSNIERIKLQFRAFTSDLEEQATVRALNRAGDQSVTAASREIRKVYNVTAAATRQQIRVASRARRGRLSFAIRIFGRRIPLLAFVRGGRTPTSDRRRRGAGVTVEVKRGQQKRISHAFIARMKSGHVGVFARAYSAKTILGSEPFRSGRGSRIRPYFDPDLPIAELTTLPVPRMFMEKTVRSAVATVARESFERNFTQQVKFLTSRSA